MLRGLFDGPGIWIVLVVVVLLFGATRLPALARSLGQSTKILREEMKSDKKPDPAAADAAASVVAPASVAPMTVAEPVAPVVAASAPLAAEPAAPKKSAKSSKATSGKSGKPAKS